VPTTGALDTATALALLREAQQLYTAALSRPATERDFTPVLAAYQRVAEKAVDESLARQAERARQRVLQIVDLHRALQAARQPVEQFDQNFERLETEYKAKAAIGEKDTAPVPEPKAEPRREGEAPAEPKAEPKAEEKAPPAPEPK
jgi:hypothetical protein